MSQGFAIPAHAMIPPGFPGALDDKKTRDLQRFDPKLAMSMLKGTPFEGGKNWPKITLTLRDDDATVRIIVEDNGKGLPKEGRERLTEPYMTTRSKGTGLGLAIVKKIMEDHGGNLVLDDREGGGARISLVFRRDAKEIASARPHATAAQ